MFLRCKIILEDILLNTMNLFKKEFVLLMS